MLFRISKKTHLKCGIDVFTHLMSLQQGFSSSNVLGQLIGRHKPSDSIDPRHEISEEERNRFVKNLLHYEVVGFCTFHLISLPEVTEEALQVMGVAQFFFALVCATHQAAPGCVQLGALLLDVIYSLRMRLNQTLCSLTKRIHLP